MVDYIGDALLAVWNAPFDQKDHPALACRAAISMLEAAPELNRRWRDRIGEPLDFGIGINTGPVLVGNTGSQTRFKYGPLGPHTNLASRLEGATKHLGVRVLLSESTRERLADDEFATRRLGRIKVIGIKEFVNVYELHPEGHSPEWERRRSIYELGLSEFEAGRFQDACATLGDILRETRGHYDRPSLHIVSRAFDQLKYPDHDFDPCFKLDGK